MFEDNVHHVLHVPMSLILFRACVDVDKHSFFDFIKVFDPNKVLAYNQHLFKIIPSYTSQMAYISMYPGNEDEQTNHQDW